MINMGKVYGSKEQAKPVVIICNMVYLHTDIERIKDNMYSYQEHQCTLSEFLTLVFRNLDVAKLLSLLEVNE